ncbi:MAG: hypothetical protein AB7O59_02030 [Pirellulales bacterium]
MDYALVDQTSDQFVGQWRQLVSTTNWEKGRIIHAWRESLQASDAPASESTDEAWSRRVGYVTPQHVGRLRRVWERFAESRESFAGLFWSHFQAALDWDDAEMWLEGAVQSDWSVAQMRAQRYEALGGPASGVAADGAGADEPWDDDAAAESETEVIGGTLEAVRDPGRSQAADEDDEPGYDRAQFDDETGTAGDDADAAAPAEPVRPFAELPPLPPDVNDAFEAYKLCILRHKLAGWAEISREAMVDSLESLKQLALAPADV